MRRVSHQNGVVLSIVAITPAIENAEQDRAGHGVFGRHGHDTHIINFSLSYK
jgi:hypothetical protein